MKKIFLILLLLFTVRSFAQISVFNKYCASPVDSVNSTITSYVDSLFSSRDISKFWDKEDYSLWEYALMSDIYMDMFHDYPAYYNISLLGIISIKEGETYNVSLCFTCNMDSVNNMLMSVYHIVAKYNAAKKSVVFENYTNEFIKNWYSERVGNILFYKEKKESINYAEAKEMNAFNDSLAHLFNTKPITDIVYFSCKDPFQMFNLKGYDFLPNMYYDKTGGMVGRGGKGTKFDYIIYSANNKEKYIHELVHFYLNQILDQDTFYTRFANEGIATYLGGSGEHPLEYHLAIFKKYIHKGNKFVFAELISDKEIKIDENVSNVYAVGGLFAKLIYEKKQLNGLNAYLKLNEKDLIKGISKILGVKEKDLEKLFYAELEKY